jgi:hypothetical protein
MELSLYDCEIHHVKGEDNEISDILSRHHPDIDQLKEDMKAAKPMSEQKNVALLNRLRMPEGEIFTKEEVAYMLEAPSLPSPDQKAKKKSQANDKLCTNVTQPKSEPTKRSEIHSRGKHPSPHLLTNVNEPAMLPHELNVLHQLQDSVKSSPDRSINTRTVQTSAKRRQIHRPLNPAKEETEKIHHDR